jgi:hypothetical protein
MGMGNMDTSRFIKKEFTVNHGNFIQFSGFSLLLGGLLATLGWILFGLFDPVYSAPEENRWIVFNLLVVFGGVFIALGLPGFYFAQAHRSGIPGLIAGTILFIGIAIPYIAVQSIEMATSPNVPPIMRMFVSIGAPSLFLGALFTGIITYAAGIFPRWVALALITSVILGLITRLYTFPPMFNKGIFPAVFTGVMGLIGFYMILKMKDNHSATQ